MYLNMETNENEFTPQLLALKGRCFGGESRAGGAGAAGAGVPRGAGG